MFLDCDWSVSVQLGPVHMIPLNGTPRLPMISPRSCFAEISLEFSEMIFPYEHAIRLTGMKSEMSFGFCPLI